MRSMSCTTLRARGLAAGSLTVVGRDKCQPEARKPLVELAREFHALPVAIVLRLATQRRSATNVIQSPARPPVRPSRHQETSPSNCGDRFEDLNAKASVVSSCCRVQRRSPRSRSCDTALEQPET